MNTFHVFATVLVIFLGFTSSVRIDFSELLTFGKNAFMEPDTLITGPLLDNITSELTSQNPEELGPYFEGDILFPKRLDARNALLSLNIRWPKKIIPYEMARNFSEEETETIRWAFDQYHKRTCIRFKPRSKEKDYIFIGNGKSGCWATPGRIGGRQEVNLQTPFCVARRGTILHELMHVLGFLHEHNRHDRDRFIKINRQNIKWYMSTAFEKLSRQKANGMGLGYDYTSVMHYSARAFSKNGQPTIEAKLDTEEASLMGQRTDFSEVDIAKINTMYKCIVCSNQNLA